WDAQTGVLLLELTGHAGPVSSVMWSASGASLVSAGDDGTARIWSAADGALARSITAHGGEPVVWAGFGDGDRIVATTGGDNQARVWDAASGRELASTRDPDVRLAGGFDRAGERLASATGGGAARFRRHGSRAPGLQRVGRLGAVVQAVWSADDQLLATASHGGTARIWDPDTGDLLLVLQHRGARVTGVAFSPDRQRLVTGRGDGLAVIWDLPALEVSGAELDRLLRCRVPYTVEEDRLIPRPRDWSACAPLPAAQ